MKPQPGDMQEVYVRCGRIDLARGPRGWWLTIWRMRPPAKHQRCRVLSERWHWDRVRIVNQHEVLL